MVEEIHVFGIQNSESRIQKEHRHYFLILGSGFWIPMGEKTEQQSGSLRGITRPKGESGYFLA
jgi:hypothetical protein